MALPIPPPPHITQVSSIGYPGTIEYIGPEPDSKEWWQSRAINAEKELGALKYKVSQPGWRANDRRRRILENVRTRDERHAVLMRRYAWGAAVALIGIPAAGTIIGVAWRLLFSVWLG